MTRGTIWQRGYAKTSGFSTTDSIVVPLLFPAERTLTRVRFSVTFVSHQDLPFAELPAAQIVLGMILLQGSPLPAIPDPIANTTDNWLWYEGMGCRTVQHTVVAGTYATLHAPISDEERDCKAQRIFDFDEPSLVWVFTQDVRGGFTPQWNMQITYSALIMGLPS